MCSALREDWALLRPGTLGLGSSSLGRGHRSPAAAISCLPSPRGAALGQGVRTFHLYPCFPSQDLPVPPATPESLGLCHLTPALHREKQEVAQMGVEPEPPQPCCRTTPQRRYQCPSEPTAHKNRKTGTRSFTFLRLSSSNCSSRGDAIRQLHRYSSGMAGPGPPPTEETRRRRSRPFCRAQARGCVLPDAQKDLDLNLGFQGKPRGLFLTMPGAWK